MLGRSRQLQFSHYLWPQRCLNRLQRMTRCLVHSASVPEGSIIRDHGCTSDRPLPEGPLPGSRKLRRCNWHMPEDSAITLCQDTIVRKIGAAVSCTSGCGNIDRAIEAHHLQGLADHQRCWKSNDYMSSASDTSSRRAEAARD